MNATGKTGPQPEGSEQTRRESGRALARLQARLDELRRDLDILRRSIEASAGLETSEQRRRKVTAARGSLSATGITSAAFLRDKHAELVREDETCAPGPVPSS